MKTEDLSAEIYTRMVSTWPMPANVKDRELDRFLATRAAKRAIELAEIFQAAAKSAVPPKAA